MTAASPPPESLRLVRGSHIVLPMPDPPEHAAYTLQDEGERIIFVIPWLDSRFLIVGTTDVSHEGDASTPKCSDEERAYLLDAYNRYFASKHGAKTAEDIVFTWSGVRALHGGSEENPSRISRKPTLATHTQGTGGFVTLYGGKLTTHRAFAEEVLAHLRTLGLAMTGAWTKNIPLQGGHLDRSTLLARAADGPDSVPAGTRRRWAFTYGDRIEDLYGRIAAAPATASEVAPGVPRAELDYAVTVEDARTAEDFLLRRTKLHLLLDEPARDAVEEWFAKS